MRLQPVNARTQAVQPKSINSSWSLRSNVHNSFKRDTLSSVIRCYATPSSPPASLNLEGSQPKDPPVASWLGLGFLINGSDFTRKAVQKHGHVWKANVLGAAIYGLAGDSGLRAFYDENNVKRFPGMSANLEQAAWVLKDDSGDPHYAIPPLDGVNWQPQEGAVTDGKMDWKQRKAQFMAGIDTRDAVETYIRALDAGISDTIAKLAASDSEFALWDTINSLVLGGLSKAFFGYGIADYELGEAAMISNIQTGYTVFDDKLGGANQKQKDAFKENVRYLREALAQYRARPHKYPWAGLGRYLAAAEKLKMPEEDILMDMHQMICVGAYGGVTSAAGCMAFSLAKNPEVRAMVKSEIGANLGTATPTFASLKQLPYTFAVLKECLRRWPIVHIVRGFSIQDIVVEGKKIPKDSTVIAALHGTMHDPTVYKDPEQFDPLRFMPPRNEGADEVWTGYQVVFGAGESSSQHACAGKNTAMLMLFVLLVRLAQNWQWELVSPWEHLVTNHFSPDPSNRLRMRRRR